jgi:HK97 family phage prohead protease
MKIGHMNIAGFKDAVNKGLTVPAATVVHKAMSLKIENAGGERRKLFTISTDAVDRDNDTIALDGWDLKAYVKNPVVLWGHQSYSPPIGKSVEIGLDGGALKAVVEFVPADMPLIGDEAEMVFRMCDMGFLSACSVGFRPLEYKTAKDRMDDDAWWPALDFTKQELMEWSICTIPANPEAVIDPDEQRATVIGAAKLNQMQAELQQEIERACDLELARRKLRIAAYS